MKYEPKADRIFPVKDGYVLCPECLKAGAEEQTARSAARDTKAIRLAAILQAV